MTNKYLAITIGPIYQTFLQVRKTRELWGASYLFSYIAKQIIEKLLAEDNNALLVPAYEENNKKGIGLYPDRIFLKRTDKVNLVKVEAIRAVVLEEIASWFKGEKSVEFLNAYFRIYAVEYAVAGDQNPVILGNTLLDTTELRTTWQLEEPDNQLLYFLRKINTLKIGEEKWISNHLDEKDIFSEVRFESMPEISTRAIRDTNTDKYKELVKKYCYSDVDLDNDDSFIKDFKDELNKDRINLPFKNYHKYVCIVKADGDRVGKYLQAIKNDFEAEIRNFSATLYNWGKESAKQIRDYAGIPIYIGGDDLLFLAPVVGKNNMHILQLTKSLNETFISNFGKLPTRSTPNGETIKPTLSFGISITYYKYPLFEALQKSDDLLHQSKDTRNTTSLSLLKHSGSSFDISLYNDADEVTNAFNKTSNFFITDNSFVSSVIHHLRDNEIVYRNIGNDQEKIKMFLLNNFEEKAYRDFIVSIAELCFAVYQKNKEPDIRKRSEKSIRELYNLLRILKFLNGHDDDK